MKPLVFIHGWGQSRQIWHQQQAYFPSAKYFNLPGHGGHLESENWLDSLASQLPAEPCILLGWSLGGTLSMQLAIHYPERIKALVLVSSTPCFREKRGWPLGCSDEVWAGFEKGIKIHPTKTMSRFFNLMLHGENPSLSRSLQSSMAQTAIDSEHPSSKQGLQHGLKLLGHLDLRSQLKNITQPTLVLHGKNDVIIPNQAGCFLAEGIPHSTQLHFEHCGHAPFLTQSEQFNTTLESWCQTI